MKNTILAKQLLAMAKQLVAAENDGIVKYTMTATKRHIAQYDKGEKTKEWDESVNFEASGRNLRECVSNAFEKAKILRNMRAVAFKDGIAQMSGWQNDKGEVPSHKDFVESQDGVAPMFMHTYDWTVTVKLLSDKPSKAALEREYKQE